jgi:kinetochore protein Spc24
MRHLEGQHYSTVKALTEEQATLGKKEVELGRCRSEREEVGGWKVGEEEGYESDV